MNKQLIYRFFIATVNITFVSFAGNSGYTTQSGYIPLSQKWDKSNLEKEIQSLAQDQLINKFFTIEHPKHMPYFVFERHEKVTSPLSGPAVDLFNGDTVIGMLEVKMENLSDFAFSEPSNKIFPLDIQRALPNLRMPIISEIKTAKRTIPLPLPHVPADYALGLKKPYGQWTAPDFIKAREESIQALSAIFKIHLQVKKEYYLSFIKDLAYFLSSDQQMQNIAAFKVGDHYFDTFLTGDNATIVLYIAPFYAPELSRRKKILDPLISALKKRYKSVIKQIALTTAPKYNCKINDLIYIAGGDADAKVRYKELLHQKIIEKNLIYSSDFCFLKNFEYQQPIKK